MIDNDDDREPEPAPRLRDGLPDPSEFCLLSGDQAARGARTSATMARAHRETSAISKAQKLWVARRPAFAFSGLADPEPWGAPVAIGALLDDLTRVIGRYLHLDDHGVHALALWIAHSWAVEWAPCSPRLAIVTPPFAAGRTTAVRMLGGLVPRPLALARTTASALLRTIDLVHPTVLIDDADAWALAQRQLRTLLAAGHARDALYLSEYSHAFESAALSCFTACAVTLAGRPPPDFAKRCITIALSPTLAHERREPLLPDQEPPLFAELRARLARWARDHGKDAVTSAPQMPAGLFGSHVANWRVLIAIAAQADVTWVQRAHAAAIALTQAHAERALDLELLADIRAALGAADRITSESLLAALLADGERPWRRMENGRALDARALAVRLRPYGVRPRVIRIENDGFARGYVAADFADAFERYLAPAETPPCVHG